MITPISAYTVQATLDTNPKGLSLLQAKDKASAASTLDTYQRADGSVATRLDAAKQTEDDKKLREVLHQVVGQTLFGQMLKAMRATQSKNPYFDGGRAEEIFQSQLDQVLVERMTQTTSRSLSEPMYKLMKKG
jgi:Rod binding domain-containing protein